MLVLWHFLFRLFFGTKLHGMMGCTLSLFYLAIIVCNLGLDYSIAPFLEHSLKNKKALRQFFRNVMFPQFLIIISIALTWYSFYPQAHHLFSLLGALDPFLTDSLAGLLAITFVIESLRKTTRTFLQLAFYTTLTAWVEIIGMVAYIVGIIAWHLTFNTITLTASWGLLLFLAIIQLLCLSIGWYHLYSSLPGEVPHEHPTENLNQRMLKTRSFVWANQCIKQIFSGNFLVPACAIQFGIEYASLIKIMTSISSWITLIANKAFGVTSNALLAHLKLRSLATQRAAFSFLTGLLNQALYFLVIFLIINGKKIAFLQVPPGEVFSWSLLYFLLIIAFFECLFILYERWYIFEEKAHWYLIFNAFGFGLLYGLMAYTPSPLALLLLVIILRAVTFVALTLFSFYWWRIWPSLRPSWRVIAVSLVISAVLYFVL